MARVCGGCTEAEVVIVIKSERDVGGRLSELTITVKPRYNHMLGTKDCMLISQVMLIPRSV